MLERGSRENEVVVCGVYDVWVDGVCRSLLYTVL
jgi:hypothetical protein